MDLQNIEKGKEDGKLTVVRFSRVYTRLKQNKRGMASRRCGVSGKGTGVQQ
jgi:hypothetical protein